MSEKRYFWHAVFQDAFGRTWKQDNPEPFATELAARRSMDSVTKSLNELRDAIRVKHFFTTGFVSAPAERFCRTM